MQQKDTHSASYYNQAEVNTVVFYVNTLIHMRLGNHVVTQDDIGVITPYRAQRQKILHCLKQNSWEQIRVGTVEEFQGTEKLIAIISTVRTTQERKIGNASSIGFLNDLRRTNVLLSRARALMILLGNQKILSADRYWRTVLTRCQEAGAIKSPEQRGTIPTLPRPPRAQTGECSMTITKEMTPLIRLRPTPPFLIPSQLKHRTQFY